MAKRVTFKAWALGLAAAIVSALGQAGYTFLTAPDLVINNWDKLWQGMLFSALFAAFAYLKKSPLPVSTED